MNSLRRSPAEIADELEDLALLKGDRSFARAAAELRRGTRPGRPAFDDDAAISRAVALFEQGAVRSLHAAFEQVAVVISPEKKARSVAERLRQKYFRNHPKNHFLDRATALRFETN